MNVAISGEKEKVEKIVGALVDAGHDVDVAKRVVIGLMSPMPDLVFAVETLTASFNNLKELPIYREGKSWKQEKWFDRFS